MAMDGSVLDFFSFSFSGVKRRKYGERWREKRRIMKAKQS